MSHFVGDLSKRTIHRTEGILPRCLGSEVDVRDLLDIHSAELRDHLLRAERWSACPRCLESVP